MTIFLKDGWVTVVAPMEGTPAYRQGLRAGDRIVEIDGQTTDGMNTVEASKLMRGEAGTKVTLKIEREGIDEQLEYTIERAVITIKMVPYSGVIEQDGKKIGYVRLARFGEEADNELQEAIEKVKAENIDGLVWYPITFFRRERKWSTPKAGTRIKTEIITPPKIPRSLIFPWLSW
jgi:carboxyl-terminal processing protease